MDDDALPAFEAAEDLHGKTILLPDLDGAQHRASAALGEDGPALAGAKQGRQRYLQDVVGFPEHDARLDAVAVAERASAPAADRSMITLTRCSSMPSAEIFVKPNGSTRRTAPQAARAPPQPSMITR